MTGAYGLRLSRISRVMSCIDTFMQFCSLPARGVKQPFRPLDDRSTYMRGEVLLARHRPSLGKEKCAPYVRAELIIHFRDIAGNAP
jgi:hypothetical protein